MEVTILLGLMTQVQFTKVSTDEQAGIEKVVACGSIELLLLLLCVVVAGLERRPTMWENAVYITAQPTFTAARSLPSKRLSPRSGKITLDAATRTPVSRRDCSSSNAN